MCNDSHLTHLVRGIGGGTWDRHSIDRRISPIPIPFVSPSQARRVGGTNANSIQDTVRLTANWPRHDGPLDIAGHRSAVRLTAPGQLHRPNGPFQGRRQGCQLHSTQGMYVFHAGNVCMYVCILSYLQVLCMYVYYHIFKYYVCMYLQVYYVCMYIIISSSSMYVCILSYLQVVCMYVCMYVYHWRLAIGARGCHCPLPPPKIFQT